ncbi:Hypothetical protein AA314_04015 [Archangium gephyra]|uniref:Uncharacterized protein n=1 Tax=Archangium gephyra TaxID=48 RepID=A0AAC8Q7G7_9BACT|nr:Hypothetical protein AA314_04015 [Archangium gephyra]
MQPPHLSPLGKRRVEISRRVRFPLELSRGGTTAIVAAATRAFRGAAQALQAPIHRFDTRDVRL